MKNEDYNKFHSLFRIVKKVHIIGAGGVGMSALALFLRKKYHLSISGSDMVFSLYLEMLQNNNCYVWEGSRPNNIPNDSIVFYSSAIPENNIERKHCIDNQIPIYNRNYLLKYITENHFTIAVCGTHGKTTTSGWLTDLFIRNHISVSCIIGGKLQEQKTHVIIGDYKIDGKPVLIFEADESDKSFLWVSAKIICIMNAELEHLENFSNTEEVFFSFQKFVEYNQSLDSHTFFSIQNNNEFVKQYFSSLYTSYQKEQKKFRIEHQTNRISYKNVSYSIGLKGRHNLYNASVVIQVSNYFSFLQKQLQGSLLNFKGMNRRLETILLIQNRNKKKITVLDDYAHHPTEVEEVVRAVLFSFSKRVYIFWEPHRLERLEYFFYDFIRVWENCSLWNQLVVLPIFFARENTSNLQKIYRKLQEHYKQSKSILENENSALEYLQKFSHQFAHQKQDSTVLFLGAGKSSFYAKYFQEQLTLSIHNTPAR